MPWVPLDDELHAHRKVLALGDDVYALAAFGMHTRSMSWCGANPTDGHVPHSLDTMYAGRNAQRFRTMLVDAELRDVCTEHPKCSVIHDWLDLNDSAEKVKERRRADADRKRRARQSKLVPRPPDIPPDGPPDVRADIDRTSNGHDAGILAESGPARSPARDAHACAPLPQPLPVGSYVGIPPPPSSVTAESVEEAIKEIRSVRREWGATAIRKALTDPEVQTRPWEIVRMAAILVARDGTSKQPGRLKQDGPWWAQAARTVAPMPEIVPQCGSCNPSRRLENPDGSDAGPCPRCHPSRRTA